MKWNVELCCGIGFTVSNIEAATRDEAIEKAKNLVLDGTNIMTDVNVDAGDLEYDQCTYVEHAGRKGN